MCRHQRKEERIHLIKDLIAKKQQEKDKYQGSNLYIKNLDDSFDDARLKQAFEQFGTINSARVMRNDKENRSRGFGFVCFENQEDAMRAMNEMNGKVVGSKPLYVSLAQKREVRRLQLEAQFRHRNAPFPMAVFPANQSVPFYATHPRQFPPHAVPAPFRQQQNQRWMPPGNGSSSVAPLNVAANGSQPMSYAQAIGRVQAGGNRHQNRNHGRQQQHHHHGNNRGYKYNQNARNRPDQQPVQTVPVANEEQLTLTNLADFPLEKQKEIIGDRLFPLVHLQNPTMSSKITGMFLEMETSDLLHLIESPDALAAKVQEAAGILNKSK